ncbi:MAG: hypothetical protein HY711_02450 [Candidatus Melainabacteria bacterium]|nr:hypothetical protein [Candidatus Melainabacteria bacterium]
MAVTVKKAVLWRRELDNQPGTLAEALRPLANARVNLQVMMGYVLPGDRTKAALEIYPVAGKKAEAAATSGGLQPATAIYSLVVQGDDRVGIGHEIADCLARAGVNISFAVMEVIGKKYSGVFGFDTEQAAHKAAELIKTTGRVLRKRATAKSSKTSSKTSTARPKAKAQSTRKAPSKATSNKGSTRSATRKATNKKSRKSAGKRK